MKKITLAIFLIICNSLSAHASEFLKSMDDFPIMPGLVEQDSKSSIYDTINGKILEAELSGNFQENEVLKFYQDSLPNLGWVIDDNWRKKNSNIMHYKRGNEELAIEINKNRVIISIKPRF